MTRQRFFQFVRFSVVGSTGNALYYVLFYGLTKLGLWYMLASTVGAILSTAVKFTFHKKWAFQNEDTVAVARQVKLYFGFFVANSIMLFALVEYVHLQSMIAQVIATIALSLVSYLLTKRIFAN